MRTMMAIMVVAAVSHAAAKSETGGGAFRLFPDGAIVVPVDVGPGARLQFLLDTGASRSAIGAGSARRLGLTAAGTMVVTTVAGTLTAPLVRLASATVGASAAAPMMALVLPERALDLRGPVDGLVGGDVLARRPFTIDYRRRTLTWHTGATAVPPGARLPLTFDGRGAVVTLPEPWPGAPPLQLIADTGAAELVFYDRGRPLPPRTPGVQAVLRGPAGVRVGRRVVLDRLDLDQVSWRGHGALVTAAPAGATVDGLLPLHLFSSVTVDGPAGVLVVRP